MNPSVVPEMTCAAPAMSMTASMHTVIAQTRRSGSTQIAVRTTLANAMSHAMAIVQREPRSHGVRVLDELAMSRS